MRTTAVSAQAVPADLNTVAGPDRVVMNHGKTYLNAWAGYGEPPRRERRASKRRTGPDRRCAAAWPRPGVTWSKVSGPGTVTFADPTAAVTTATFSAPGEYVVQVDGRQRHGQGDLDARGEGGTAAAARAARPRGHAAPHGHRPVLGVADEGADHVVDSALHRRRSTAPTSRPGAATAASTTSSRRPRRCAASRTPRTRATCSRTRGCTRRSSRSAWR